MPHFALNILNASDFAETLIFDDYVVCPLRTHENGSEGHSRLIMEAIFDDLAFIDRSDGTAVESYLHSIETPIRELIADGFQLFALVTKGFWRNHQGMQINDWKRVYYLVVRKGAYVAFDAPYPVTAIHRFSPGCTEVLSQLSKAASLPRPLRTWTDRMSVQSNFESTIPWCPNCCAEEFATIQ